MGLTPCPGKRSHINPGSPPRKCLMCARFLYACHLGAEPWMKPAIKVNECPNYVERT